MRLIPSLDEFISNYEVTWGPTGNEGEYTGLQPSLFAKLNKFSESYPLLGRAFAIPVAIADVYLETIKGPITAIESVALIAINLVGMALYTTFKVKSCKACSLENIMICTMFLVASTAETLMSLVKAIPRLIWQIGVITIDPVRAQSIMMPTSFKQSFDSESYIHPSDYNDGSV